MDRGLMLPVHMGLACGLPERSTLGMPTGTVQQHRSLPEHPENTVQLVSVQSALGRYLRRRVR